MCGYPQEIQDFMECLQNNRKPKSDVMLAAYVLAQDQGRETEIPLIA